MDAVGLILGGGAGLVGALFLGIRWGSRLRTRPAWRYWAANAYVMLGGVLLAYQGLIQGWPWISGASLGVMAGGITGLKYGLGRSVGAWRTVDRLTGSDELPR